MSRVIRRIHGLLCRCEMCAADPSAAELITQFTKRARLSGAAAPAGITALGVAMLLLGEGTASGLTPAAVAAVLAAIALAGVGVCLLAIDWAWKEPTR